MGGAGACGDGAVLQPRRQPAGAARGGNQAPKGCNAPRRQEGRASAHSDGPRAVQDGAVQGRSRGLPARAQRRASAMPAGDVHPSGVVLPGAGAAPVCAQRVHPGVRRAAVRVHLAGRRHRVPAHGRPQGGGPRVHGGQHPQPAQSASVGLPHAVVPPGGPRARVGNGPAVCVQGGAGGRGADAGDSGRLHGARYVQGGGVRAQPLHPLRGRPAAARHAGRCAVRAERAAGGRGQLPGGRTGGREVRGGQGRQQCGALPGAARQVLRHAGR
mmetsp:Transcript_32398/g.82779  ORF Transcript_32398/g.82779 Transcript_32398/m.82779 type:complete len:271 (+) Transcript_32398:974-1786(+)